MFLVPKKKHSPLLDSFGQFFETPESWLNTVSSQQLSAPISVRSDEENVYIDSELPGVSKKDVQIEYHDGILSIEATKTDKKEVKENAYSYSERSFGKVARSVRIGSEIDFDKAKAELSDGVLHIQLPKAESNKRKTLAISA